MLRATQSDAGGQGGRARRDDTERKGSAQPTGAALRAKAKGGGDRNFLCAYGKCLHKAQAAEGWAVPTSVLEGVCVMGPCTPCIHWVHADMVSEPSRAPG